MHKCDKIIVTPTSVVKLHLIGPGPHSFSFYCNGNHYRTGNNQDEEKLLKYLNRGYCKYSN